MTVCFQDPPFIVPVDEEGALGAESSGKMHTANVTASQLSCIEKLASRSTAIARPRDLQTARVGLQVARRRAPSAIRALCIQRPCKLNEGARARCAAERRIEAENGRSAHVRRYGMALADCL